MPLREGPIRVDDDATRDLVARARATLREGDAAGAARELAGLAGARVRGDHVEFGFWLPGADEGEDAAVLEVLTPEGPPGDPDAAPGVPDGRARPEAPLRVPARRQRLPLVREGDWAFLAVRGASLGARERLGSLYRVRARRSGREEIRHDPLAASLPFGGHGPAEVYDVPRLNAERPDTDFFRRVAIGGEDEEGEPPRFGPPAHVLEVHVGTATHGGTIADLADLYRALARKLEAGEPPTPGEACFLNHDAIELMPIEPVAVAADAAPSFRASGEGPEATLELRAPRAVNWGYDVLLHGAAAIEPSLLRSGRPDELVDLAGVLRSFPGTPIRLILDLVLGHAHPQGRALLPPGFLGDDGPYGPRPDLRVPEVRALLLEAARRKADLGADGLRIDASHELLLTDPETGEPDDGFLTALGETVGRVADVRFRPFTIFEDGRRRPGGGPPGFRDVVRRQEAAAQWGPLTYAEAHPALDGYWASVGWRLEEIAAHGARWITGSANHDTLRRAHGVAEALPVNGRLGGDRPSVLRRAYDHPAADLLVYGLLPGVPMTFASALLNAPWAFFRDAEDDAVRDTAAAEAAALRWRFAPEDYAAPGAFRRLKELGLHDRDAAHAALLAREDVAVARAYLVDLRDACVVWNGERHLDPARVETGRALRRVRRERAWLAHDLRDGDRIGRRVRDDGSVLIGGVRHAPDGGESVALLANLEGEPWSLVPAEALRSDGWSPLVTTPGAAWRGEREPLELPDAEGVLLCREV